MAPTKTDTGHGALFDSFPDRPQSLHGGAKFDEGFNLQPKPAGRAGRNFDEFGNPTAPENGQHGEIFDDWREWTSMPDAHGGTMFDEGFGEHTANQSSQGPLFDLFQPSTQVKFIYDGQDSEGIVDHVRQDGVVMVAPRGGGKAVEVDLGQFLGYRSPSMDNATTTAERSTAEAPSAWDQIAHGAKRGAAPDIGTPVQPVSEGPGNTNGRSDVDADWSVVDHLKTLLGEDDVAKAAGEPGYSHSEITVGGLRSGMNEHYHGSNVIGISSHASNRDGITASGITGSTSRPLAGHFASHREAHQAIVAHHQSLGKTTGSLLNVAKVRLPSERLRSYSEWSGVTTIAKEVTVAETAVQAEEGRATLAGAKGAGSYCPECREQKGKLTDDGRCPDCNTVLKAHEPGVISREKGDGNGSSEDSSTPGVADKTNTSFGELRKAFGAAADPGAGGQTVTWDGSPHSQGQQTGQATSDPDGPEVPEREHKDSDHHGNLSGVPTTCPHCGQVIAELDAKTEEGAPTHKCLEGLLGVTKTEKETSAFDALRSLVAA